MPTLLENILGERDSDLHLRKEWMMTHTGIQGNLGSPVRESHYRI